VRRDATVSISIPARLHTSAVNWSILRCSISRASKLCCCHYRATGSAKSFKSCLPLEWLKVARTSRPRVAVTLSVGLSPQISAKTDPCYTTLFLQACKHRESEVDAPGVTEAIARWFKLISSLESREQSQIKARIVVKISGHGRKSLFPQRKLEGNRIAYIDLFAGPGRYEDGTISTPLMVLQRAIEDRTSEAC